MLKSLSQNIVRASLVLVQICALTASFTISTMLYPSKISAPTIGTGLLPFFSSHLVWALVCPILRGPTGSEKRRPSLSTIICTNICFRCSSSFSSWPVADFRGGGTVDRRMAFLPGSSLSMRPILKMQCADPRPFQTSRSYKLRPPVHTAESQNGVGPSFIKTLLEILVRYRPAVRCICIGHSRSSRGRKAGPSKTSVI